MRAFESACQNPGGEVGTKSSQTIFIISAGDQANKYRRSHQETQCTQYKVDYELFTQYLCSALALLHDRRSRSWGTVSTCVTKYRTSKAPRDRDHLSQHHLSRSYPWDIGLLTREDQGILRTAPQAVHYHLRDWEHFTTLFFFVKWHRYCALMTIYSSRLQKPSCLTICTGNPTHYTTDSTHIASEIEIISIRWILCQRAYYVIMILSSSRLR
jgi:hypothetical protein